MRYHIAINGQPAKCTAKTRACPRGEHFETIGGASQYLDAHPELALDRTDYDALYNRDASTRAWREKTAAWDAEEKAKTPKETSAQVLQSIPAANRLQITPQQLDAVYGIMREFGTRHDDSWGFRRHIADASTRSYEWSERGAGYRYNQSISHDGRITDVRLSDISDYEENPARRYAGQARIREALGLKAYTPREIDYIATEYYNSHNLAALGVVPKDAVKMLREAYVAEVQRQPGLIQQVVADWAEHPEVRIGDVRTYVENAVEEKKDREALLAAVERKSAPAFEWAVRQLNSYRTPLQQITALSRYGKRMGKVWREERELARA